MPRNMSFALTTKQVKQKTKTITRRQGWSFLKVDDLLQPVEKGMGLKKGEKVKKIGGLIRVVSIRKEPINKIRKPDVIKEGFPELTPKEFVQMYCKCNKVNEEDLCNRIVFEYITGEDR